MWVALDCSHDVLEYSSEGSLASEPVELGRRSCPCEVSQTAHRGSATSEMVAPVRDEKRGARGHPIGRRAALAFVENQHSRPAHLLLVRSASDWRLGRDTSIAPESSSSASLAA